MTGCVKNVGQVSNELHILAHQINSISGELFDRDYKPQLAYHQVQY
jgi:hypothetical protein